MQRRVKSTNVQSEKIGLHYTLAQLIQYKWSCTVQVELYCREWYHEGGIGHGCTRIEVMGMSMRMGVQCKCRLAWFIPSLGGASDVDKTCGQCQMAAEFSVSACSPHYLGVVYQPVGGGLINLLC